MPHSRVHTEPILLHGKTTECENCDHIDRWTEKPPGMNVDRANVTLYRLEVQVPHKWGFCTFSDSFSHRHSQSFPINSINHYQHEFPLLSHRKPILCVFHLLQSCSCFLYANANCWPLHGISVSLYMAGPAMLEYQNRDDHQTTL